MGPGERFFVRIDEKLTDSETDSVTLRAHIAFLEELSRSAELYAGCFHDAPGMIVCRAESLEKAEELFRRDPLVTNGYYGFRLHEWTLQVASPPTPPANSSGKP